MFDRRGIRKYLNKAERMAYFQAAERETDRSRRSFCLLLLFTGCRISEALNLTAARVDVSQGCVVFETLKRRQDGVFRDVPVPDSLMLLLTERMEGLGPADRLWPISRVTAWRMVKRLMLEVSISGGRACPKGLRHGFAVASIDEKVPLTTIQKWLGHARLETTAIYLSVSGPEERSLARRLWF